MSFYCKYSIMGVSIFGGQSPQEFGQFEQAFVTMFRLTTDGGWPEMIPQYDEDGGVNWKCAAFMMSYIIVVNWVVLQVSQIFKCVLVFCVVCRI
jgi:hypothetical protein